MSQSSSRNPGRAGMFVASLLTVLTVALPTTAAENQPLSVSERLDCQRAIEEVYWRHRIWPEQNPGPKPSVDQLVSSETVQRKVDDTLRLTTALADRWGQPVSSTDLQAELDRMVAETQAPEVLDELFHALGYDAMLAAECLARPILVDRLAHSAFDSDEIIHGATRQAAMDELNRVSASPDEKWSDGEYREFEWIRFGAERSKRDLLNDPRVSARLPLSISQFDDRTSALEKVLDGKPDGIFSSLQESAEAFWAAAVLERGSERHRLATVKWPRADFDEWWSRSKSEFAAAAPSGFDGYEIGTTCGAPAVSNSWSATLNDTSTPSARTNHSAIWTGSEMIVWGGQSTMGILYGGAKYDPATNDWASMANGSAVGARADHTAIWTGSNMWVWGGWSNGELNTGGIYSVSGDSWSTMSTTSAPTARRYHTAVWGGSEMYIWGGHDGTDFLNTGGRTQGTSWTNLTTANAPSARSDHIAAWVIGGNPSMVIWGGQDDDSALGDGGRLGTLTGPFWYGLPTDGAPTPRWGHSAVFGSGTSVSDQRILIWGGRNDVGGLITGAALHNVNGWRPITPSGAPSSRWGHTAVWTGKTMIVWGGEGSGGVLSSGGVYNYLNQRWTAMTTSGAPSARVGHSAVFRPNLSYPNKGVYVVWGGDDGSPTKTGGSYTPPSDFVVSANYRDLYVVPGAYKTVRVHVYSLNDFSGTVTLSTAGTPLSSQTYGTNPLTPYVNGSAYTDVSFWFFNGIGLGDTSFSMTGTSGGATRSFAMTAHVGDFGFSCDPASVSAEPGGSAETTCTVSSQGWFDQAVTLDSSYFPSTWDTNPVTPPEGGTVSTDVTINIPAGQPPATYTAELVATSMNAYRIFNVEVNVDSGIFSDGFESSDLGEWSSSQP